jgi:hypothetical protein
MMKKAGLILCFFILVLIIPAAGQVKVIKETKQESKICNLILMLPVVKNADNYVRKTSHGKRHLFTYISNEPTKADNYYWVCVAEDNGTSYYTYFTFLVAPKTYSILYLDVTNDDKRVPLKQCNKRLLNEYRVDK